MSRLQTNSNSSVDRTPCKRRRTAIASPTDPATLPLSLSASPLTSSPSALYTLSLSFRQLSFAFSLCLSLFNTLFFLSAQLFPSSSAVRLPLSLRSTRFAIAQPPPSISPSHRCCSVSGLLSLPTHLRTLHCRFTHMRSNISTSFPSSLVRACGGNFGRMPRLLYVCHEAQNRST